MALRMHVGWRALAVRADAVSALRYASVRMVQTDAKDTPKKPDLPSAAPAGTVFTGLSIYKDQPDPIAQPDSAYPRWLWDLLEDPAIVSSKATISGDIDTSGMSKGEARVAYKRHAKIARAQIKKQQVAQAKEAARLLNMSPTQKAAAAAKAAAQAAREARPKTPSEIATIDRQARSVLRKKSRDAIKANNFVRSA